MTRASHAPLGRHQTMRDVIVTSLDELTAAAADWRAVMSEAPRVAGLGRCCRPATCLQTDKYRHELTKYERNGGGGGRVAAVRCALRGNPAEKLHGRPIRDGFAAACPFLARVMGGRPRACLAPLRECVPTAVCRLEAAPRRQEMRGHAHSRSIETDMHPRREQTLPSRRYAIKLST